MCRLALVACLLLGLGLALASRADAYIYWGNQSNGNFGPTISRSNTDGSSADPNFMSGFGIDDPEGMVTDGKYLFFANGQGNTLGMSNLDGSNVNGDIVTECVNNALPCYPQGMAIQGNQLYWANFGSLYDIGSIGHATIDYVNGNYTGLSDVNPKFIYPLVSAHAVAIRGSDIFWSDQQSIGHANVNGDTVTNVNENWIVDDNNFQGTYIGTTAAPWGMAIDNNDLYWTHTTQAATEANYGQWNLNFAAAGAYHVEVYTAAAYATSHAADYVIQANGAMQSVTIDQTAVDGAQDGMVLRGGAEGAVVGDH